MVVTSSTRSAQSCGRAVGRAQTMDVVYSFLLEFAESDEMGMMEQACRKCRAMVHSFVEKDLDKWHDWRTHGRHDHHKRWPLSVPEFHHRKGLPSPGSLWYRYFRAAAEYERHLS